MFRLFIILFSSALLAEARTFDNPILRDNDYPDPGTIKVDGVYYIVTTTNNDHPEKFPIHTSTDLINWKLSGYVFNASNLPSWSNKEHEYWAPEIHRVHNMYHVYFTARYHDDGPTAIGVAMSDNVAGPYTCLDEPLYRDPDNGVLDSTIINDNGTFYFVWKGKEGYIYGRLLNPDGITFPSDEITKIIHDEYGWEDGTVEAPWYVRHGRYHYLLYSGHGYCSDLYRVGVARALSPLGPYTKRGDPILASNQQFQGPGHNSVVKDLNDVDDLIVFHAFRINEVCDPYPRLTLLASMGWGDDEWPYVFDF